MSRYVLLPNAERDLREIRRYYLERHSPRPARTILGAITEAFRSLSKNPGLGHKRADLTGKPYLFWPVHSYIVIYRAQTRPIEIIAVLHGARDVPRILHNR